MKPLSEVRYGFIGAGQIAPYAAQAERAIAIAESSRTGREVRLA